MFIVQRWRSTVSGRAGHVVGLHVDEELLAAERGVGGVAVERGLGRKAVVLVAELRVERQQPRGRTDATGRVEVR